MATEFSFRTDSHQSGRETPQSQKEIPRPLRTIHEIERDPAPELDRSIDLFIVSKPLAEEPIFEPLLNQIAVQDGHPLFNLPVHIRRKIYGYCFPYESRKISLSPRFATKAVFPDDYFASPWDVLEPVFGGLQAFGGLRRELMIYFWTEYHFHATLSPFSGPKFSPLSHTWLTPYLEIIQHLTVEADLTRFGCSALKVAAQYGYDMHKTEELMARIVKGLTKRRGKHTIAEFNIMCRRYAGFRPYEGSDDATFEFEAVQYCPDDVQFLCDAYIDLRGILHKSRISGFTLEYTETLFRATFADGDDEPQYDWATDCAWPPVPVQSPYELFNSPLGGTPIVSTTPSQFELLFTATSNFTQDVEDEMLRYESSVYSEKTNVPAEDASISDRLPKSGTSSTLADHVNKYQECVGSIAGSEKSNRSSPQIRFSDADSERHLLATTPSIQSRCATPNPPSNIERMNKQNEQDPAFVKTVDALRSLSDGEPKPAKKPRPKSMIPSPKLRKVESTNGDRSQTSLGAHPRTEGTVRRYLSFVKRLRGRVE